MSTMHTRNTLLALLLALPGLAQAASESEANDPVTSAQALEIADIAVDGVATTGSVVDGVVGVISGKSQLDFDYYAFEGQEGDVVTLDIDRGWNGARRVDTVLAIFGPAPAYRLLFYNDDKSPVDPGSISSRDSRIVNFRLPANGVYTVGVAAFQSMSRNVWVSDAEPTGSVVRSTESNGDYTLIVSGVSLAVQQISIEIKPGSGDVAPINPKAKGRVPVALLGSSAFSVEDVDKASLTFGSTGNEASLAKCGSPADVNGDVFPDMVCHFDNQAAAFALTDDAATLRGRLGNGKKFEGRGWLKVIPVKAQ